ncbi:MAG: xylulokinase [Burkholderiaceae bacterium]
MSLLMGIDLGAGSLKTMIVDTDGRVRGSASHDVATHSPRPRWSEQNPEDWWRAVCDTVPRALSEARTKPSQIAAVSFSAGAHTPVLEDADGRVLRPAILWSDQRSGIESAELDREHGERILALGLNRPTPTWTLSQFKWLATHEPQVVAATRRVHVAKDWLRSRLTGTWETDETEATGTLLYEPFNHRWSEELCAMVGWDPATLPPLVTPTTVVGRVSAAAAAQCGLAAGTPVVCGTSDTSAEVFGAGSTEPGESAVKLATAATINVVGDTPTVHRSLINYPFAVPGRWYTITGTNSCASAHRWLRDRLFVGDGRSTAGVFDEMERLAAEVAPGSDGLLFHPYLQGERAPHWDPLLRASYVGLTFAHHRGHLVRALYEGIAFALREIQEQFHAQGIRFSSGRLIGGGARSATWRQIVADVLGIEVRLPEVTDASYGAALLAGVGIGAFSSEVEAARRCTRVVEVLAPDEGRRAVYDQMFALYKQTQVALAPVHHGLARVSESLAGTRSERSPQ